MNARTIAALFATVILVAGAALALNLFALASADRHHVHGYGVSSHLPSYVDTRPCRDDPVGCSLVVW